MQQVGLLVLRKDCKAANGIVFNSIKKFACFLSLPNINYIVYGCL